MSDLPDRPFTNTPQGQPDPARVGATRLTPCFEHFCAVCGAAGGFRFGGDLLHGDPGLWACTAHRAEVERMWRSGVKAKPPAS